MSISPEDNLELLYESLYFYFIKFLMALETICDAPEKEKNAVWFLKKDFLNHVHTILFQEQFLLSGAQWRELCILVSLVAGVIPDDTGEIAHNNAETRLAVRKQSQKVAALMEPETRRVYSILWPGSNGVLPASLDAPET